jgi:hypothetical protein
MPNYPDNPTWLIAGYPSALSFLDWRTRYIRPWTSTSDRKRRTGVKVEGRESIADEKPETSSWPQAG